MKAVIIKVRGDVQGVNFRYWAKKIAEKIGVMGWTKNEHDGTVTIFAQGEPEKIEKMIDWANEGSPMSTVEKTEVIEAEEEILSGFQVK